MAATEPIRDKKQLKQLAEYYFSRGQYRNYAMIVLGTCTALRISDLLKLTWDDVYDKKTGQFYSHITVVEQKTGKPKTIAFNKQVLRALRFCYAKRRGRFIFASNRGDQAISRVQAWRIVQAAVEVVGIAGKISCHSMRKSWGYHAWMDNIASPVVIMEILNHSNYETTRRYLGIVQDDLDKAYLNMTLF